MSDIKKVDEVTEKKFKLRVENHPFREFPNAYCVKNDFGFYCGGKLIRFVQNEKMKGYTCPTVFKSKASAERFIKQETMEVD